MHGIIISNQFLFSIVTTVDTVVCEHIFTLGIKYYSFLPIHLENLLFVTLY